MLSKHEVINWFYGSIILRYLIGPAVFWVFKKVLLTPILNFLKKILVKTEHDIAALLHGYNKSMDKGHDAKRHVCHDGLCQVR